MRNHLLVAIQPGALPGLADATPKGFCLVRGRNFAEIQMPVAPAGLTLCRLGTAKTCRPDEEAEIEIEALARPNGLDISFPVHSITTFGRPSRLGVVSYHLPIDVFAHDAHRVLTDHFGGHVYAVNPNNDPRRNWIGHLVVDSASQSVPLSFVLRAAEKTPTLNGGLPS